MILAAKINGDLSTWAYASEIWTDTTTLNTSTEVLRRPRARAFPTSRGAVKVPVLVELLVYFSALGFHHQRLNTLVCTCAVRTRAAMCCLLASHSVACPTRAWQACPVVMRMCSAISQSIVHYGAMHMVKGAAAAFN
jgi:hypothetical protein